MADNVTLNAGLGGDSIAADDVGGAKYQRVKLSVGDDGSAADAKSGGGTEAGSLRVTIASDSTGVLSVDDNGGSLTVDGTVSITGTVAVTDNSSTLSVDDGAGSLTVDGTVAATQSGNWTARIADGAGNNLTSKSAGSERAISVAIVDGSGNQVTSFGGSGGTSMTDDAAFTPASGSITPIGCMFDDVAPDSVNEGDGGVVRMSANRNMYVNIRDNAGNERGLNIDSSGQLAVTLASSQTLATVTNVATIGTSVTPGTSAAHLGKAEDAAAASGDTGVAVLSVRQDTLASSTSTDGDYAHLKSSATGAVYVNVAEGGIAGFVNDAALTIGTSQGVPVMGRASAAAPTDVSADNDAVHSWMLRSGAQVVQPSYSGVLASAGNGASGTGVLRVTVANDSTGVLATVSTVTTVSTLTGGAVAHDSADSGNPVKVGAKCSLTLSDDTIVSNADRTDLTSDGDGALLVRGQFPLGDLISERVSNTDGNSTAFTNFGAVASTRSYITAISLYNSSATAGYVDFRDGTGGSVLYTVAIPATGGAVLSGSLPLFRTSANTALAFDVSAALSTVYISVSGFKSKV